MAGESSPTGLNSWQWMLNTMKETIFCRHYSTAQWHYEKTSAMFPWAKTTLSVLYSCTCFTPFTLHHKQTGSLTTRKIKSSVLFWMLTFDMSLRCPFPSPSNHAVSSHLPCMHHKHAQDNGTAWVNKEKMNAMSLLIAVARQKRKFKGKLYLLTLSAFNQYRA